MSDDVPFRLPPSIRPRPRTFHSRPSRRSGSRASWPTGDDELAAWTLRHAMDESSRVDVYDGLLREAMRLVGERWVTGRWSIAEEHLASRTLLCTHERLRPELGPEGRIGPLAVLAGVAGEHHMIGLACLEQLLAEDGWSVAILGADLPAEDRGVFVARNEVALGALSAMDGARAGAIADALLAVRDAAGDRPIGVVVGGGIAAVPGLATTVEADGVAHSLAEAVELARSHRPG